MIKAFRIASGIYQGPCPSALATVRQNGFHVLVFCAREIQPYVPVDQRNGVHLLYVPLNDNPSEPMTDAEWDAAHSTGREIARLNAGGARILTTCAMGLNRSGVVNAVALHYRYGVSGERAIERIRATRGGNALGNPSFVTRLSRLPRRA